jgi:tyrosyl-tRNA synthetase
MTTPIIEKLLSIGSCVEQSELEALLSSSKPSFIAYNGFEPSGQMTFAQCMTAVINVNKLTSCNVNFIFWVADTFAKLNNKLGQDMKKIHKAGELMIEIWLTAGMDMSKVKFLWASEEINKNPEKYWQLVMDIANSFTIGRMIKCTPALGREESDELHMSSLMYAAMQCADVFFLNVDIIQMGLDQLKINMLVREYCDKIKRKHKPIILSHKILGGLDGKDKMSKSSPDTAIFMTDDELTVGRKIKKAFCEPGNPTGPIFDMCRDILLQLGPLKIDASRSYDNFEILCQDFVSGLLHPSDLKPAVSCRINEILLPVRTHFESGPAFQLLKEVRSYKLTK